MSYFGILNVIKPTGCTSRRAVDLVQRIVRPAKVGHAGTLDPLATGVLVICVGQATRLISYIQELPKTYRATFLLGRRSETDDTEGDVAVISDARIPTHAEIEQALPEFLGDIAQVPPAHSAVKIAGRRAYNLARAGKAVELSPRIVTIHALAITRYEYPQLELDIRCGSGTYVRALGRDLAATLGTNAVMSALERTAVGNFRLQNSLALDKLTPEVITTHLQPAISALSLRQIKLDASQLTELRHGRPVIDDLKRDLLGAGSSAEYAALDPTGELAAIICEKRPGEFWPVANFT